MTKPSKHSVGLSFVIVLSAAVVAITAYANTKSTKDGAFTAAQAERGKLVYDKSCATCHQANLHDVLKRFENRSVEQLFEAVSTAMPADNPGSLTSSEYVDTFAYMFSITGSPPGDEELNPDNIAAVTVGPVM